MERCYGGPVVDGRETWLCLGRDIPEGWERRLNSDSGWGGARPYGSFWYQVRPKREPDPVWLDQGRCGPADGGYTTWGEMKARKDLDQWERMGPGGEWGIDYWETLRVWRPKDEFPILVRRKQASLAVSDSEQP